MPKNSQQATPKKPEGDRTPDRFTWQPGDIQIVDDKKNKPDTAEESDDNEAE